MKIQNIGLSHEVIHEIKNLKRKSSDNVVIEDLSILKFLKEDSKKLEVFLYCKEIVNQKETLELVDYFIKNSKQVYEISQKTYLNIVEKENSAGLIGVYKDTILSLKDVKPSKHKFVVVLDGLENPGNIGTLLRTSDGASVNLVIIVNENVKVNSFKVVQSSRGMSLFIDKVVDSYENVQKYLLDNNYDIYLGEPIKGKSYKDYKYDGNIALIVGNERFGIDSRWYDNKHKEVFIPMSGKMGCLNVSIAGSILIYEAFVNRNSK